jgi:hypothetical protein
VSSSSYWWRTVASTTAAQFLHSRIIGRILPRTINDCPYGDLIGNPIRTEKSPSRTFSGVPRCSERITAKPDRTPIGREQPLASNRTDAAGEDRQQEMTHQKNPACRSFLSSGAHWWIGREVCGVQCRHFAR